MQKAKAFFYVCAGMFLIALSCHLGARNASAQMGGTTAVGVSLSNANSGVCALAANGDVYLATDPSLRVWQLAGNIFAAGPTNVERHSLGQLKARFRDPAPVGR